MCDDNNTHERGSPMRLHLIASAVAAALLLGVFPGAPGGREAAAATPRECPDLRFDGTIRVPAGVGILLAEAVINEDCSVTQFVPRAISASQAIPLTNPDLQIRQPFVKIGGPGPGPDPDYHENNQIIDPWGVNLTQIVTDINATTNGSTITGWSGGGYQQYHGEVPDPTCGNGPGWYPLSGNGLYYWSGGTGQTWVAVHTQGWFGYKGQFDCSGNTYENHLDNYVYAYADNSVLCSYNQWWKTGFPGWRLYVTCWNPFVVKYDHTLQ
jgi:hypothetical protein